MTIEGQLSNVHWSRHIDNIRNQGYTILPKVLDKVACESLIDNYYSPDIYRKTISMETYRFGKGTYKYFQYPLPEMVQTLRTSLYPHLVPIANQWMKFVGINNLYSGKLTDLIKVCHHSKQERPTPLILKYEKGDYNNLHQDLYGDIYFPFQAIVMLSEPEVDFKGGELVLLEQKPRMQSKAIVAQPKRGDIVLLTTNFRPVAGSRGYYRVKMKHGVSEVLHGQRFTLGIIFHDAK